MGVDSFRLVNLFLVGSNDLRRSHFVIESVTNREWDKEREG